MARETGVIATNDTYLEETTSDWALSYPFSIGGWFRADDVANAYWLLAVAEALAQSNYAGLLLRGDVAGDPVAAISRNGGGHAVKEARHQNATLANTWHHVVGTFQATEVNSWLDGVEGTNPITSVDTIGDPWDRLRIGFSADSSADAPTEANFEDWAIWDALLGADDIAALAAGVPAKRVRQDAHRHFWPLDGVFDPEPDHTGSGASLTLVNSPPRANGAPRAVYFPVSAPVLELAAEPTVTVDMWNTPDVGPQVVPPLVGVPY